MKSINYGNRTRFNILIRVGVGALGAILLWTYPNWNALCSSDDPACHVSLDTIPRRPLETTVLAHAPGFTVLEHAYWRNHTWYFVSSKKWAFPEIRHVVTNAPWYDEETRWDDSVARVVTPKEAINLDLDVRNVEVVQGSSIFFNDKVYLGHFYHLVGEMFMGAWAAYTSILQDPVLNSDSQMQTPWIRTRQATVDRLPEVRRLIFGHAPPDLVYDHAGMNSFFFNGVFPAAEWEFEEDWNARADSHRVYRFDRVTIADRRSGHMGVGFGKPMDPAFDSLERPMDWISSLKNRILRNYAGKISPNLPDKPVVTYLSRQTAAHRHLTDKAHKDLIASLKALEKEGVAEVRIEEFTDADPKDEQVAKLSRTAIFVSLHGNGLTNLIWMTPDVHGRSTVFEIQQKGMFMDDYAVLTEALGMEHWIIGGRAQGIDFCQRRTCGIRGIDDGIRVGKKEYDLDIPELVRRIRQRLLAPSQSA